MNYSLTLVQMSTMDDILGTDPIGPCCMADRKYRSALGRVRSAQETTLVVELRLPLDRADEAMHVENAGFASIALPGTTDIVFEQWLGALLRDIASVPMGKEAEGREGSTRKFFSPKWVPALEAIWRLQCSQSNFICFCRLQDTTSNNRMLQFRGYSSSISPDQAYECAFSNGG